MQFDIQSLLKTEALNQEISFTNPYFAIPCSIALTSALLPYFNRILTTYLKSQTKLNLDTDRAKATAGLITLIAKHYHLSPEAKAIKNKGPRLMLFGQHKATVEILAFASLIDGDPIRFLATTTFNCIPFVKAFLDMFKIIFVEFDPKKKQKGESKRKAIEALRAGDTVGLFPQGRFCRPNDAAPGIISGAAEMAVDEKVPIDVYSMDGYWCLENPLIPSFIRDNGYYRAFFAAMHPNNLNYTLCEKIDFHFQDEYEQMRWIEKVYEINAILYAYYRHPQELCKAQYEQIAEHIKSGEHRPIWESKANIMDAQKELKGLNDNHKVLSVGKLPNNYTKANISTEVKIKSSFWGFFDYSQTNKWPALKNKVCQQIVSNTIKELENNQEALEQKHALRF